MIKAYGVSMYLCLSKDLWNFSTKNKFKIYQIVILQIHNNFWNYYQIFYSSILFVKITFIKTLSIKMDNKMKALFCKEQYTRN